MKKNISIVFLSILFLSFKLSAQTITIEVKNPIAIQRDQETISLPLMLEFQQKNLAVFEGKKEIVSQLIDENSDGKNDEIIFQSSFKPKETKTFSIVVTEKPSSFPSVVDGRFVLPREDFAWENDRVAFRVYGSPIAGNVLNGIDAWTKRVRYPIVKKWYDGEEQTPKIVYHEDHGEGADFFSVGKSLGCGSAGVLRNGKLIQAGLFSYYRVVANGPIRVLFELYYPDWKIDSANYLEIKKVTLDAGQQLNRIETRFISELPTDASLTIAAGIVKRKNVVSQKSAENRWTALWGLTNDDAVNEYLGTAVVFPRVTYNVVIEDSVHCLLSGTANANIPFTYYSGFAWTRAGDIKSKLEWIEYLQNFQTKIDNPLQIKIKK